MLEGVNDVADILLERPLSRAPMAAAEMLKEG